jgi:hypothetical protein
MGWHAHAHEAKRLTALQSGGVGVANPMRIKVSGLPLCKAGEWGLQTSEKCFCFGFFCGGFHTPLFFVVFFFFPPPPQKKPQQKGAWGCAPMGNTR